CAFLLTMPQQIMLCQIFHFDNRIRHRDSMIPSNYVREAGFHSQKSPGSPPYQDAGDNCAERYAGPIKLYSVQKAPTKAVNHAYDRIERIQEAPVRRHNAGTKSHWRNIK